MLFKWGKLESPKCDCGSEKQNITHEKCSLRSYSGNRDLLTVTDDAIHYLNSLDVKL